MLFSTDYDTPPSWQAVQQAAAGRLTVVPAPGYASKAKPRGNVLRVEVRPGELTDTGGYRAARSEVYARHAVPGSTPSERWPDPPGSTRWYEWSLLVPTGHVFATDARWLTVIQFKGYRGGSPPLAIEIKRKNLRLGGARTNAGVIPNDGNLGPIKPGSWTRLRVGIGYATDQSGWVEVWRDGKPVLQQTNVATLDLINGQPDPCYLKQGIYRDSRWDVPHVIYFGPVTISEERP
jgi:hypothetical protein